MSDVTQLKQVGSASHGVWFAYWEVGATFIDVFHERVVADAGGPVKLDQMYRRDLVTVQAVDAINVSADLDGVGFPAGGQSDNGFVSGKLRTWVGQCGETALGSI